jgi:hypothetical protein
MLEISTERSSTMILPIPIDLIKPFLERGALSGQQPSETPGADR